MTPIQPPGAVVVGVDGSDHSDRAVRTAAVLAALERRRLHVLHAPGEVSGTLPHGLGEPTPAGADGHPGTAQAILDRARATALSVAPGLDVSTEVAHRDPREALERASRTARAVVVGSRGLGPVRSMLLGSVGLHVAQHARCPAVVVRPAAGPRETEPDRIVVATSGTESSTAAMEFAFAHAALLDVPLTVVHCFDFRHGLAGLTDLDLEGLLVGRRAIAESVAGMREKYPDVDVDFELGRGPAVPYLAHASEEAAMIVVGAARRAGADADAVDPVTRGVVEHAHSTVAVVPTAT